MPEADFTLLGENVAKILEGQREIIERLDQIEDRLDELVPKARMQSRRLTVVEEHLGVIDSRINALEGEQ
jgi:tetrahydromethanopterin S-methyltransferase subunit G